jgi:O-succinylhomoserine sulfhydrylase
LYLTSSFVFEDAEDMRLCRGKTGIFTADTATQTTTNLLAKYALWKVLQLVLLCIWYGSGVFHYGCFIEFGDHIVSSSSVFGATHSLFINYFQNGT